MAFSPFDIFRRNQKIIMSGIVIGVMFMFVLSFGQGDFFDWFPKWLGGKKSRGDVLAVIDGDKFRESEAGQIRTKRNQANAYMSAAAEKAKGNLFTYAKDNVGKASPENRSAFQGVLDNHSILLTVMKAPPEMRQMYMQIPQIQAGLTSYQNAIRRVDALLRDAKTKPDDLDLANSLRKYILLTELTGQSERHYFLNQPNKSAKDAIEFTLWLKKADQLKIRFRGDDVGAMIEQEFLQLKADDREKIFQEMLKDGGRQTGVTKDSILDAIGDEFRVRLAQSAVLGLSDTRFVGRSGHAPFDFYEFYRTETSPAEYGVITVPVENYISKVEGQPTETELREIFNKAKNTEPDPGELKIGIKKGRELKLGWVEFTGKEPFYSTASADALAKAEVAAKMSGLFTVPVGPGALGIALSAGTLKVDDPALQGEYDNYRQGHEQATTMWFFDSPFSRVKPLDTSYASPQIAAATVGLAASPLSTAATPFAVSNGTLVSADGYERRQRLFSGLAMLAPPSFGGVGILTQHTGNLAAANQGLPKALPLPAVKAKLVIDTKDRLRFSLAQQDLKKFQDELAKINKGEDKDKSQKEAEEYINKFVSPVSNWIDADKKPQLGRGLKIGGSTGFYDQHTIGDDPGLMLLKARLEGPHSGAMTNFGKRFFFEEDFRGGQPRPTVGLFAPFTYPETDTRFPSPNAFQSQFLVWRTAEIPSEASKDFEKAKPKCLEIWKRQKARELARKAAEELAAKTGTLGKDFLTIGGKLREVHVGYMGQFSNFPDMERAKYFEIKNVAATNVNLGDERSGGITGTPYTMGPTPELPYPTQKIVEELVANRTKPISSSFVMLDRPELRFYVAVLISRVVNGEANFVRRVYSPEPESLRTNQLSGEIERKFEFEARKQAREEAVELLKAEFKYEKEIENKEKLTGGAGD